MHEDPSTRTGCTVVEPPDKVRASRTGVDRSGVDPVLVPGMLQLALPPSHQVDSLHLAKLRDLITQALEFRERKANRAGNQTIIDGIGLRARRHRDEAYYAEALDYHLGLLYAYVGEPALAARYIASSGTLPGSGGNQVFSEHGSESLKLRRQQELAKERLVPPVLISSMPRSGSASLTQTISALLDIPIMRASCGYFPNYYLITRWFDAFYAGGAVLHDHFGAIPWNLELLRERNVRHVFVRIRDPRAATASLVNLGYRGETDRSGYDDRVVYYYEQTYIPWLCAWIEVASNAGSGLRVHWLAHKPQATSETATEVLCVLAESHPVLKEYATTTIPEVKANFAMGDDEAWRASIGGRVQARLWEATPQSVRELLGLRP